MKIRDGELADLPRLIEMAENFLMLTTYGGLLIPAPGKLEAFVELILTHGKAIVAEVPHPERPEYWQLVGMIGLVALPHPITGQLIAEEVAWWVEPHSRKGTIGPRLLQAAEDWASVKGVTVLKMVAPAGSDVGTYYERRGYKALETAFVKVIT